MTAAVPQKFEQIKSLVQSQYAAALEENFELVEASGREIIRICSNLSKGVLTPDQQEEIKQIANKTSLVIASKHHDTAAQLTKVTAGLKISASYKM